MSNAAIKEPLDLYVSSADADAAFINRLRQDLRVHSFSVHTRDETAASGDKLQQARASSNLIRRSDVILLGISPAFIATEFTRREQALAQRRDKYIIPLRIAPCDVTLLRIDYLQHIDFVAHYDHAFQKLLLTLHMWGKVKSGALRARRKRTMRNRGILIGATLGVIFALITGTTVPQPSPLGVLANVFVAVFTYSPLLMLIGGLLGRRLGTDRTFKTR